MDFKDIHIGKLIEKRIIEMGIEMPRICNFLNVSEHEVNEMLSSKSIDSNCLLRWSKILQYDFFRIYSHHLILYSPKGPNKPTKKDRSLLPVFRKNIYTHEIINFILYLINSGAKTKEDVIDYYKIPKTTLYNWLRKKNFNKPK